MQILGQTWLILWHWLVGQEMNVSMTYIPRSSDFPVSWRLFDIWTSLFGIMNQYDPTFDLKVNVDHYDVYFMIQWICVISWRIFGVCASYFGIMGQYDQTFDHIFWSSDFALYLKDCLMDECHIFGKRDRVTQSKKISNDQELIQSDPISCPQNQKGNN